MEYGEEVVRPVAAVAEVTQRRLIRHLRSAVQLALAVVLLGGLLWRVDLGAVRDDLADATLWWLPVAFVANLASDLFRAVRWRQFFAPMKRLPVSFLFGTAVLGVACNIILPLRAGEVVRVQVLRRRTGLRVASIVATLLSEKLMDVVAFSSFVVVGLLLYEEARFLWPLALAYGAVLTAGIYGARRLARRVQEPEPLWGQPEGRWREWLATQLHGLGHGLQSFRSGRVLAFVSAASIAAWLCEAGMYYACGRALGLDLSPVVYLLVVVSATVAVSVPVTQAGLGVFELAITGLLVAFGVGEAEAAAYSLFAHVMLALPYICSGPIAAIALRLSLKDVLFLRVAPEAEAAEPA